jgi:hypothetical protein
MRDDIIQVLTILICYSFPIRWWQVPGINIGRRIIILLIIRYRFSWVIKNKNISGFLNKNRGRCWNREIVNGMVGIWIIVIIKRNKIKIKIKIKRRRKS